MLTCLNLYSRFRLVFQVLSCYLCILGGRDWRSANKANKVLFGWSTAMELAELYLFIHDGWPPMAAYRSSSLNVSTILNMWASKQSNIYILKIQTSLQNIYILFEFVIKFRRFFFWNLDKSRATPGMVSEVCLFSFRKNGYLNTLKKPYRLVKYL